MASSSLHPRLLSAFTGDRLSSCSSLRLRPSPRSVLGTNQIRMQFSKALKDLLFSRREDDGLQYQRKKLQPGKISPCLPVPAHIQKPPYANSRQLPGMASGPQIHDKLGIGYMRASGKLAAQVLQYAGTLVKPGIKTDEIDQAVHHMIIDNGAYPSPLGYGGFPKSVCTSVNECICHGIPDSRALEDGDIINIDVTVYLDGYHGDTSATFFCGNVDEDAKKLVEVTRDCLHRAISICAPGVEFNRIGKTIQDYADKYQFGVVRHFVGHGVGKVFHSDPVILHYNRSHFYKLYQRSCRCFINALSREPYERFSKFSFVSSHVIYPLGSLLGNRERGRMVIGQTFTIEPMLSMGSINVVTWDDKWTAVTEDGSLSAQFEHTLLITEDGAEILTQC